MGDNEGDSTGGHGHVVLPRHFGPSGKLVIALTLGSSIGGFLIGMAIQL